MKTAIYAANTTSLAGAKGGQAARAEAAVIRAQPQFFTQQLSVVDFESAAVQDLLLEALKQQALGLGLTELRFDTHGGPRSPAGFFRALGYQPVEDYNGNPSARH